MGAVCYKPKQSSSIRKEDILRALNDRQLRDQITEPECISGPTHTGAGKQSKNSTD